MRQPLPQPWVDRIFEKLTLVYGREFVNRWESTGMPLDRVKADWAHELAGFIDFPDAIARALQHLPIDRAPTVLQFRDICRAAPAKPMAALTFAGSPMPPEVRVQLDGLLKKMKSKGENN